MGYEDYEVNDQVILRETGRKGVVRFVEGFWIYVWMITEDRNVMVKADKLRKLHRKFRGMKNRPPF